MNPASAPRADPVHDPRVCPEALYVHVPFCAARCAYCDFASEVWSAGRARVYLDALAAELDAKLRWLAALFPSAGPFAPRTVYVGGGTPTVLAREGLLEAFLAVLARVRPERAVEFTVEANPGTFGARELDALRRAGVNRLSLGVQTFQPRLLALLGRIHSADQAREAVRLARAAGFDNLSLDLIHGLPTQTLAELDADVDAAADLAPEHVSAYGLSYEEGTPLARAVARGELAPLGPEGEREHALRVIERLEARGFAQYEISNYARPGRESRHNLVYWRNEAYLGLGPSAASCLNAERTVNARGLDDYAAAIRAHGDATVTRERLEGDARAREALVLALRLREGVDPDEFRARWGYDFARAEAAALDRFRAQGVLERTAAGRWRLTRAGLPVADAILAEFV